MYNIPLGGGLFRQPWAIGGSGSTYIYGYCDATFEEGWGEERTVKFVQDGQYSSTLHFLTRTKIIVDEPFLADERVDSS